MLNIFNYKNFKVWNSDNGISCICKNNLTIHIKISVVKVLQYICEASSNWVNNDYCL